MIIRLRELLEEDKKFKKYISNKFQDIYYYFNKYFSYLNKEEFELLKKFLEDWFSYNKPILKRDYIKYKKLFEKLNNNSKVPLPKKIYRGISFPTLKEYNKFLKNIKTIGLEGSMKYEYEPKDHKKYLDASSWSYTKTVPKEFLPGGEFCENKYGCLLSLEKPIYSKYIILNFGGLFKTDSEKRDFIFNIFKFEYKKNKEMIKNSSLKKLQHTSLFGPMSGSVYGIKEDEIILNFIPPEDSSKINILESNIKKG